MYFTTGHPLRPEKLSHNASKPAPAGCFNLNSIACLHFNSGTSSEHFDFAIVADHLIYAEFSCFTAVYSERRYASMAGEYTGIHRLQEFDAANYAVATLVASCSAASFASGKFLQQYWKTQFQYFGVSDTRVGHVRVYRIAAAAFLLQE